MAFDRTAAEAVAKGERPMPEGPEFRTLVADLKGVSEFGLARQVLARARAARPNEAWIVQQLAICTYKDEELLPSVRFADALALLDGIGLRDPVPAARDADGGEERHETLSLGGAVYKRMWESGGRIEHLRQSLAFYSAAWELDRAQAYRHKGYGGVNAAFILDVLASRERVIERRGGAAGDEVRRLTERARAIRDDVREGLEAFVKERTAAEKDWSLERDYWLLVTMAEVHFGLAGYERATALLGAARKLDPKDWEAQSTWHQLTSIARAQGVDVSEAGERQGTASARRALQAFLGEGAKQALSKAPGRVGLALSGGGFRASLYHVGVLARLAEADVLRSVDVLSTVSGGSILGAHYYLEVRRLLQTKPDAAITRQDYVEIVERVAAAFLAGVQRNLRTRTLANLGRNLLMISKTYSRSNRIGELYEAELYGRIADDGSRNMPELLVTPKDVPAGQPFKPAFSNWRRGAKVPVLLLNATSLNSGHAWHFTAKSMGEPPGLVGPEVDVNEQYRRLWYEQAPTEDQRRFRMGYAVAASACVPGLFAPLTLDGLYPGRTVRLVDGGVHDNQGVMGLLSEGCNRILCSDASGQMTDVKRPADGLLAVPLRTNGILMSRVREAEYLDLKTRADARTIQGFLFVHLKKGLEALPLDWVRCQDPTPPLVQPSSATAYGVDKDIQRKLSAVRTDLDSFTEVEAFALMLDGYLVTEHELRALNARHVRDGEPGTWGGFDVDAPRGAWPFLQLETLMSLPPDASDARREDLGKQLEASASLAFKIWKLSPLLNVVSTLLVLGVLVGLGWIVRDRWGTTVHLPGFSMPFSGLVLSILAAVGAFVWPVIKWANPRKAMRGYLWKALAALGGWVASNVHLCVFDPMYLRRGRLKRLLELE